MMNYRFYFYYQNMSKADEYINERNITDDIFICSWDWETLFKSLGLRLAGDIV